MTRPETPADCSLLSDEDIAWCREIASRARPMTGDVADLVADLLPPVPLADLAGAA